MHIYKFRMLSDENDNFLRDIEIQATQTFQDFHQMISDCVILKGNELASFHITDQRWNKLTEITLVDMQKGLEPGEKANPIEDVHVMKNSTIRDFINEPSQRLLYEYDFFDVKTFFIELISVFKQKEDHVYPRCTLKRGEVFEETVTDIIEEDDEELRTQLLQDMEDLQDDTLDLHSDNDLGGDSDNDLDADMGEDNFDK